MRLLVAEDDLSVAGFLEKGLREERYTVDVANDGEEALKLTQDVAYDLIILDVMLPKRNGLNVCRSIRQAGKAMPVLMLTVRDSTEDKVLGLDSGADDYLTKPFPFPELLARIRALLRRGAAPIGRLRVADLDLDPVAHRVWRGGIEIPVTNKEYAVLEYLLRNLGRVLTRTAIIEHVWDYQY
ncbi:MAG TPA: response regulator transcription factor, partial [Nitrospira sp.]|nr:response regulator transcription factor [Nitrospira sp.]